MSIELPAAALCTLIAHSGLGGLGTLVRRAEAEMALESGAFVGRRPALDVLASELRRGAEEPRIVWVEGEPGIGKTSLVRAAVAQVDDGRPLVWAGAAEEERALPFGVLERILRGLEGAGSSSPNPRQSIFAGADPLALGADLLEMIAETSPAPVLVLDDLQWIDEESARAVLFALRRLESEPAAMIVTSHPNALDPFGGWVRLLSDPARVRWVELGGLEVGELVTLADALGAGQLDPATAQRLRDHTAGHPLHARALLSEVGAAGLTARAGVLPVPRALAALIVARLGGLPADARTLVAASAVLGFTCRLTDAAIVAALDDPLSACDDAIRAELVVNPEPHELAFPHPLVRAAVYNDLSLTARRQLHLAAAEVCVGVASLEHRVAAAIGPDADLAEELEALAVSETAEQRAVLASRHWRQAAVLSKAPKDHDRLVFLAVECLFAAGMSTQVRALGTEVQGCADPTYHDAAASFLAFAEGRVADAENHLSQALNEDLPKEISPRLAAALGFVHMLLGEWEASVDRSRVALSGGAGWSTGLALYALALGYAHLGRVADLDRLHQEVQTDMTQGILPRSEALSVLGVINLWTGDLDRAVAELAEVVKRSRAGEQTRMLVATLASLSEVHFRQGQWGEAAVMAELGVSLARDGQVIGMQRAHCEAAVVHARCGRFDLSHAHIDEMAAVEALVPWWGATALTGLSRAVLAEARGDAQAMYDAMAPLFTGTAGGPLGQLPPWRWTVLEVDARIGVGDLAGAEAELKALDALVAFRRIGSAEAELARARGRLAEAKGDHARAKVNYREAITSPTAYPYTRARCRVDLGRVHRIERRTDEAVQELLSARAELTALGAGPDLRLCGIELAAAGRSVVHQDSADRLGLTAAELSVASLVAQGLTNREVAARLYISAKTVEYHLGHIYPKLNISGRHQLADQLVANESAEPG